MYHRDNGDLDFLRLLAAALHQRRDSALLLLTASPGAMACLTAFQLSKSSKCYRRLFLTGDLLC